MWSGFTLRIPATVLEHVAPVHLAEAVMWALFFVLVGGLPDVESAAYSSLASYTTVARRTQPAISTSSAVTYTSQRLLAKVRRQRRLATTGQNRNEFWNRCT